MNNYLLTLILSILCLPCIAEQYRTELGLAVGQGETGSFDSDTTTFAANFYLNDIETSHGPLREAAFLSKSSGIFLDYSEIDVDNLFTTKNTNLSARWVSESDWIIIAGLGQADTPLGDADSLTLGAGVYLNNNSEITFAYTNSDNADGVSVDYHNLMNEGKFAIDLGLDYLDGDSGDGTSATLAGTWYPQVNLGLSAQTTLSSGDLDYDFTAIAAEYFVTPNVSFSLVYGNGEENGLDTDLLLAGIALRM